MNEARVVASLKQLISDNADNLCFGLVHQEQARRFMQITTSNLTPPIGYYYLLIYVTDVAEKTQPSAIKNTARGSRMTRYGIQMELADEAMVQAGDDEAYETMHNDFRVLSDRLAELIESNVRIGTNPTLVLERDSLNDRVVTKTNLSGTWTDTEGNGWASLYCQFTFGLVDGCGTTDLYD